MSHTRSCRGWNAWWSCCASHLYGVAVCFMVHHALRGGPRPWFSPLCNTCTQRSEHVGTFDTEAMFMWPRSSRQRVICQGDLITSDLSCSQPHTL